jgi:hypothetical protein
MMSKAGVLRHFPSPTNPERIDAVATVSGVSATAAAGTMVAHGAGAIQLPPGQELKASAGRLKAKMKVARVRREINEEFDETYTRAMAWCVYIHRGKTVEERCELLDEIGAQSPIRNKDWNAYHREYGKKVGQLVDRVIRSMKKKGFI